MLGHTVNQHMYQTDLFFYQLVLNLRQNQFDALVNRTNQSHIVNSMLGCFKHENISVGN